MVWLDGQGIRRNMIGKSCDRMTCFVDASHLPSPSHPVNVPWAQEQSGNGGREVGYACSQ